MLYSLKRSLNIQDGLGEVVVQGKSEGIGKEEKEDCTC